MEREQELDHDEQLHSDAASLGSGRIIDITVQWHLDYEPHEGHSVGYGTATDESCISLAAMGTAW